MTRDEARKRAIAKGHDMTEWEPSPLSGAQDCRCRKCGGEMRAWSEEVIDDYADATETECSEGRIADA